MEAEQTVRRRKGPALKEEAAVKNTVEKPAVANGNRQSAPQQQKGPGAVLFCALVVLALALAAWNIGYSDVNNYTYSFASGAPLSNSTSKIIGLLEIRNAERQIGFLLSTLVDVVDAVVILDDHSSDSTVPMAIESARRLKMRELALITKRGSWMRRQELRDRQLLLERGRATGGTHFVLLDYDEFFAASCTRDGRLRAAILNLQPGESLYLPWYEAWRSPHWHRVLGGREGGKRDESELNFLRRRQTIIFADRADRTPEYDAPSTLARTIGDDASATIHALRCPRSVCPPPSVSSSASARRLHDRCGIVEMRFVNLENALAKATWYEALGRRFGANDSTTRGKMLDYVLGEDGGDKVHHRQLRPMPPGFLAYDDWNDDLYSGIEAWRIDEVLHWSQRSGGGVEELLSRLPTGAAIRWGELQRHWRAHSRRLHGTLRSLPRYTRRRQVCLLVHAASMPAELLQHAAVVIGMKDDAAAVIAAGKVPSLRNLPDVLAAEQRLRELATASAAAAAASASASFDDEEIQAENDSTYDEYQKNVHDGIERSTVAVMAVDHTAVEGWLQVATLLTDVEVNVVFLHALPTWSVDGVAVQTLGNLAGRARKESEQLHSFRVLETDACALVDLRASVALAKAVRDRDFESDGDYDRESWTRWPPLDTTWSTCVLRSAMRTHDALKRAGLSSVPPVARMIFSINAGRSGSRYLSKLLESATGATFRSVHEPACPQKQCTSGGALRMHERSLEDSYKYRRGIKMPMLLVELADLLLKYVPTVDTVDPAKNVSARSTGAVVRCGQRLCKRYNIADELIYSETNPNFKSWFYDIVLREFSSAFDIDIVVLRKWPPALARSLYETGFFSTRDGYQWMETAWSLNARTDPISPSDHDQSALTKIVSYIVNTEATANYIRSLPEARRSHFIDARSERIFTLEGAKELLQALRLGVDRNMAEVVDTVSDKFREDDTHRRLDGKDVKKGDKLRLTRISLQDCVEAWESYLDAAAHADISLPRFVDRDSNFDYDE